MLRHLLFCAALPLLCAEPSLAGAPEAEPSQSATAPADAAAPIKRMRDYLLSTPEIEFETTFSAAGDLPGLSRNGTAHYFVRRPNSFRVEVKSNKGELVFVSDGVVFTLSRPGAGKYAQIPARDTMLGTMYLAIGLMNLEAKLVDFLWVADHGIGMTVAEGGPETVGGSTCNRFTVSRFEDSYEVWLAATEPPLPCKLQSRSLVGNDRMTQTNEIRWKPNPAIPAETFDFSPPAGSRKVDVSDLN